MAPPVRQLRNLSELPRLFRNRSRFLLIAALLVLVGCATDLTREQAREHFAQLDLAAYRAHGPTVVKPVTLNDALRYADRYNIDVWVAARERQFQSELVTHALLKLLPELRVGGESSRRSEYDAARSVSLQSGEESLEPSYSAEKDVRRWNISTTWSMIDFGISFFRMRQQASREQIAAERERRLRQNLALEVTRAYWQAVTARAVARRADCVDAEVIGTLEGLRAEMEARTISEVEGLQRETALLEQQEELQRYRRAYLSARAELATLMGLPPGTLLTLAEVDLSVEPPPIELDLSELEWEALRSRPELYEKDLEVAISRDEARVTLAQMFPNLSLFWRYEGDRNRYLFFDEWQQAGMNVSWNLLALPAQWQQHRALELQTDLIGKRRMAVAVAILTQLHLAAIDCAQADEEHRLRRDIAEKHQRLLAAMAAAAEEGTSHAGQTLEHKLKQIKAQARSLGSLANLMIARARVENTVGRNLVPAAADDD